MTGLPVGWTSVGLGAVCELIPGQSPPGSTYNDHGEGLPFYQGKAEFGALRPTPVKWCSAPVRTAEVDDVLISVRAPVGPTNLCPERSCVGRGLAAIRPLSGISSRYVLYALRSVESHIAQMGTGSTFAAISGDVLRAFEIPLAPLAEQRRIVAAIEEHLSRLDAAVAGLKRVQAQLPRYRAAVMKAAVEGRLVTAESESARAERRQADTAQHWLDQLGLPNAVTERPAGPPGWQMVPLMSLVRESSYGTSEKCEYDGTGPPVLRIPNVADGQVDLSDLKRGNGAWTRRQGSELAPGDLLVVRTNGSRNLIGRAAVITTKFAEPHFFASYLIRLRLVGDQLLWHWIALWWGSPRARALLESLAATSAGQYNISLGKLDQLSVPLPPRAEAVRILEEFDRLLSLASAGSEVSVAATRAERLRQSILLRAFSGKLVPQDPNDEPASMLLTRIRTARAAAPIKPGRPRRAAARC